MKKNSRGGFTLVELMIVIAIIGVLAAIAIPKFSSMLERSREGATKGNLGSIKSSVSNYYADQQGTYPATLNTASFTIRGQSYPAFLPRYIDHLPAVKASALNSANGANKNLGPGVGNNAGSVTLGTYSSPAFVATSVGKGWKYNAATGDVWVNSRLKDMSGKSYTVYGLE